MRTIYVEGYPCGPRYCVREQDSDLPGVTLEKLLAFYREHHKYCPRRSEWVSTCPEPKQPACCPPGDCRGTCGYIGVAQKVEPILNNIPTLLESMVAAKPCIDVVTVALAKKYVGEALAHLTGGNPADVRGARAVRVLSEFVTRIDPPKEQPCE